MPDFKHDLALSLLDADEPQGRELVRLLPALSVFIYSERERELVGQDGVEEFSSVFGRDSRTVTVLHREQWGGTRWTRIEAEAIRTRLFLEGADFLTLIKLDSAPAPPWMPANRIWGDFARLGIAGVAAVLAERINARGRTVRSETASELADRLLLERETDAIRLGFLRSPQGVDAAFKSAVVLFDEFARLGAVIGASASREEHREIQVFREGYSVTMNWHAAHNNTLEDSELCIKEWKGRPDVGGRFWGPKQELAMHLFDFEQPSPGDTGWRDRSNDRVFSALQLADWAGSLLMHRLRAIRHR